MYCLIAICLFVAFLFGDNNSALLIGAALFGVADSIDSVATAIKNKISGDDY